MNLTDKLIILMSTGLIIALTSPLSGLFFYPDGGINAFYITMIPFSIGALMMFVSIFYPDKNPIDKFN